MKIMSDALSKIVIRSSCNKAGRGIISNISLPASISSNKTATTYVATGFAVLLEYGVKNLFK